MRVHVYGNVLNIGFYVVQQLRKSGVDAILFLDNSSPFKQDFPWWEDAKLTPKNLPLWIKYYETKPFFLLPSKETRRMINDFKNCDVALVSCWGPILASMAKVKFLFYPIGGDLNGISIKTDLKSVFLAKLSLKQRIFKLIKIATYSQLQKRAIIKKANHIFVFMGYQEKPYIADFGLWYKTTREIPLWNIDNYVVPKNIEFQEKFKDWEIVFFMPARHSWYSLWNDPKGNDKFIRAYAKFVKEHKPNVILICIEKGGDFEKSKELIQTLEIGKYVKWVTEMNKEGIRNFESLTNCVVVDQFGHNNWSKKFPAENNEVRMGFGLTGLEALSASTPIITAFSDSVYYNGEIPPILYAYTELEIYKRICEVYNMKQDERETMGRNGHLFLQKWFNSDNIDSYIKKLKEIAAS
jgi:glycosyltransferase involved in cell wall biosynthesis